jgi:ketosteroid isomerase-like protein
MSESDVTVVRELLDTFNRGDYDASTAMLHEEAEFHQAPEIPDTRSYFGRDEFARGVARWVSGFEDGFQFTPVEMIDAGERVLVRIRLRGRGRGSGVEMEDEAFQVYEVRDEQPYRCWVFWSEEDARRQAGL